MYRATSIAILVGSVVISSYSHAMDTGVNRSGTQQQLELGSTASDMPKLNDGMKQQCNDAVNKQTFSGKPLKDTCCGLGVCHPFGPYLGVCSSFNDSMCSADITGSGSKADSAPAVKSQKTSDTSDDSGSEAPQAKVASEMPSAKPSSGAVDTGSSVRGNGPTNSGSPNASGIESGAKASTGNGGSPNSNSSTNASNSNPGSNNNNKDNTNNNSGNSNANNGGGGNGDSSGDLQRCQQLQSDANACCYDATKCGVNLTSNNGTSGGGLSGTCQQANQAVGNNSEINYQLGNACLQRYTTCHDTCSSLADNASGDTANTMRSIATSCTSLSPQVTALNNQSIASLNTANSGVNCENAASAMPSMSMPSSPSASSSTDPTSAASTAQAAQAAAANTLAQEQGKSNLGFTGGTTNTTSANQNVGNLTDLTGQRFGINPMDNPNLANQAAGGMGGAQGGGGGSFGGGGAGNAANLNNPFPARAGGISHSNITAIERGLRSGGGYNQGGGAPGNSIVDDSPSGGGARRGPASVGSGFSPFDLKAYLPGGRLDPARRPGGSMLYPGEIASKTADLFKNVSNRFMEKCKLGLLYDCR